LPQFHPDGIHQRFFAHRFHDAGGAQDRDPALDAKARVKGFAGQLLPLGDGYLNMQPAGIIGQAANLLHVFLDHPPGHRVDRRRPHRLIQTASGDTPYALPAVNADPGIYGSDLRKNKGPIGDIRVISAILFNGAGHTALLHPDFPHAEFQQEPFGRHERDLFFPTAGQKHPRSSLCSSRCAGPGGIPQPQPFAAFCNVLFHRVTV